MEIPINPQKILTAVTDTIKSLWNGKSVTLLSGLAKNSPMLKEHYVKIAGLVGVAVLALLTYYISKSRKGSPKGDGGGKPAETEKPQKAIQVEPRPKPEAKAAKPAKAETKPTETASAEPAKQVQGQEIQKVVTLGDLSKIPDYKLNDLLDDKDSIYNDNYTIKANKKNLEEYENSNDYKRHAKSASIYYNQSQLSETDALRTTFQREPTNLFSRQMYKKENLKSKLGYENGIYNDKAARKENGSKFTEQPNTISIYSETYLWNPLGGSNKKEVACLSLPAPALDDVKQANYKYYIEGNRLNGQKYKQEMKVLFGMVERATLDKKDTAFQGKGIKRVVLTKFGQNNFLNALTQAEKDIARGIYRDEMQQFIGRMRDAGVEIVMNDFSESAAQASDAKEKGADKWLDSTVYGSILDVSKDGDFIINPWDPHSAPGNGNDGDPSFDGWIGRATAILLTQTSWFNKKLRSPEALVPVN